MPRLTRTTSDDPDFRSLVQLLDQDLLVRDGAEQGFYGQFNKLDNIKHTVVAYEGAEPVACGAIKEYSPELMEVKRMFVHPAHRGKGIAQAILTQLEYWAKEMHYTGCVLETGKRQPEAIRLYQKCGYELIPNYGQYIGVENSVCMQKQLV